MTGLLRQPPSAAELERLYHELALVGAPAVGSRRAWPYEPQGIEQLVALAGEMLRYDPRLLTILLQLVLTRWRRINPLALRQAMAGMRWPQALAVVFEFVREATTDPELRHFADYVTAGWSRVEPAERFFLDLERTGSRRAGRRDGRSLRQYERWGFFGLERPTADMVTRRTVGSFDARTRRSILARLLRERGEITLAEYLDAIGHAVSRQQARNDLRGHPDLVVEGRGPGARWRVAPAPPDGTTRR